MLLRLFHLLPFSFLGENMTICILKLYNYFFRIVFLIFFNVASALFDIFFLLGVASILLIDLLLCLDLGFSGANFKFRAKSSSSEMTSPSPLPAEGLVLAIGTPASIENGNQKF